MLDFSEALPTAGLPAVRGSDKEVGAEDLGVRTALRLGKSPERVEQSQLLQQCLVLLTRVRRPVR